MEKIYTPMRPITSKHINRTLRHFLPVRTVNRLLRESDRHESRKEKAVRRSLAVNEWTDIYYGLPEA